jgi:hypothetical protein
MSCLTLILWAWLNASSAAPLLSVSVELSGFERGTAADQFVNAAYKGLLVRLVGEGLAFVDTTANADLRVRLRRLPGAITIDVETAVGASRARLPLAALGEGEQLRLMHTTLELVRAARAELLKVRDAPVVARPPAAGPPTTAPALRSTPPPPSTWTFGARADAGVMVSGRDAGLLTEVSAVARHRAWVLSLVGGLHKPLGLAAELSLLEWGVLAGLAYRVSVSPRFALEPVLAAGLWQHRYRYADASGAADHGSWLDPALAARLQASVRLTPAWRIGLVVGTLVTLHARVHETAAGTLWRGPQLRPTATLALEGLW